MNCFSEGVVGASLLLLLMEGTGQSHIFKVFAEGYMFESCIKSSFSRRNIFIRLCYEKLLPPCEGRREPGDRI